ncbi:FAD-dependent oxidoreductase [Eggerthella sp. YY7918]|uniref:FAD-dependent oxidoreductase n=1 Tax=Eggerthella sp. (strain YY7918) TaxID=502558 RepID=UPI0002171393|nr:FAD-dependent oxidoreductase [Eggerthella sp. YY7918]BAK45352.1 succinate dehydrogenase [Eggerthella sp. YY7918]
MATSMDRRSFLGLGAMGALVAGAGLVGCSPQQKEATAADTQSDGATGQETQAGIPRKEGSSTKECDVAVVGAGAAGLMAALKLSEAGKKVVVIEKAPSAAMSNFSMCGGPTACETKLQEQEGAPVSLDTIFNYMYDFSRSGVNGMLLRNCLANTGEAINTMLDLGIPMMLIPDTYGVGFRGRHMFQTGGEERVAPIIKAIEAAGGELVYSTAAEKIIMEDGKAVGVQTDKGVDIMAPSVVVCTGGFLGGEDMQLDRFNTKVYPLGNTLSDGTGINIVLDAGGAWDRNFAVFGNECGAVSAATTGRPFTEDWHNVNEHYGYWLFGGLYTDTAGERYINEEKIAQFPLAIGGEALLRAGKSYVIMDSDYYEAVKGDGIFAYLGQPASWVSGPMADFYKTTSENADAHLQQAIDEGWALKADTVAELAEKYALDNLEATVEKYNAYCESGVDEDFGKSAPFLKPVKTAPFYLFEYVPSAWGTNGGVKVDSHLRAMDKDNHPIPGLYVAGVDQGSVYSMPYYTNEGASVGLALGSGVYVAKEIAGA